jgi:organic hydroperoxide reductase OsmC/OhrA
MGKEHHYQISVAWIGNQGLGTQDYRSYERSHKISSEGKPDLMGSADPLFRGNASQWNPEELLIASLSACHMLWFLHLCSTRKIIVSEYTDTPTALLMIEASGDGLFKEAALNPLIVLTDVSRIEEARHLHEEAHQKCFIAKAINFPVKLNPSFKTG